MVAAQDGNLEMVRLLLEAGALTDVRNEHAQTALHLAVGCHHAPVIEALIASGADIRILDKEVYDLLMLRTSEMNLNPVNTPSLESDAAIDMGLGALFTEVAATPVAIEAQPPIQPNPVAVTEFLNSVREGTHVTVQRFIEMGLPLDEMDQNEDSALHLAIRRGSIHIVHLLIDAGVSLNRTNIAGHTPLQLALNRGNLELIATIRAAGGRIRS